MTGDERFRAITLADMSMPGGWSVSDGQTFLYTSDERDLMRRARAFVQKEVLPHAAEAHRRVKHIKAGCEGRERRERLRDIARGYLRQLGEAGLTGALYPAGYGGNGRGVAAECIVDEELTAAGHPGDTIRAVSVTLGTVSILRYGTAARKARHIPARLRGDELGAVPAAHRHVRGRLLQARRDVRRPRRRPRGPEGGEGLMATMPGGPTETPDLEEIETTDLAVSPPWMTILHNCDCHTFEQVVTQLMKAIGCSEDKGWELAWQVHNTGKAVVKVASETECVRVGNILASIGLIVTVTQS